MAAEPVIQTVGLSKAFGEKVAVRDLSLEVQRGEVFGFLGPNGAGKTTAVKMLLGLVTPTSGQGRLLGAPLGDHRARQRVGFLPEHFRFHEWLTAQEFLRLHADLYRMPAANARVRIPDLLELVGLRQHTTRRLRAFSKGMLQRIGLAQALLNNPELVILDEPTSGLDPVGRRLVRDIIRDLRAQGATVFLNSHLLSEVEVTCDRVAFIKHGEVVRVASLHGQVDGGVQVEVRANGLNADILAALSRQVQHLQIEGDRIQLTVADETQVPSINRFLVSQGVEVFALTPRHTSLEDLFIQIVGVHEEL